MSGPGKEANVLEIRSIFMRLDQKAVNLGDPIVMQGSGEESLSLFWLARVFPVCVCICVHTCARTYTPGVGQGKRWLQRSLELLLGAF